MKHNVKRTLALLLTFVMLVGLFPMSAFADEVTEPETSGTPEVTPVPAVSATPEVTPVPEASATPEDTPTPEASDTPETTPTSEDSDTSDESEETADTASVYAVTIDSAEITLSGIRVTKQLTATVTKDGETLADAAIAWTSSNTAVATVDADGLVTSNGVGNATITAEYTADDATVYSASCAVTVTATHNVFSNTFSTIAPGVTQNIKYAYAADGKQMVYYIATADVNRSDVVVQTSYLNQHENGIMGMEKLTNQMAFANQKYTNHNDELFISDYYTAVAGVNASFYNMTTGQPMGITFIDGVSFGTSSYDNFFAILTNGKAVIDYAKNLSNYVDANGNSTIWQAVAGSQWLVRDGMDVTAGISGSYNTDRHSRTCVGITEDGKVVTMVLDGRQEPFSCGGSMHELAQIMLEAGCVAAINLDGGGSTTYAARQAGSDTVKVINRPSDGSERSISAGLIIASTAAPSDVFATAVLTAENEYVTPDSEVNISAVGVSPAGTSAVIPESVTWQLADSTLGTVENGVFTSNGTIGDAVVQMVYEGKVVGETTIHVVVPDAIAFDQAEMVVPFGKTVEIGVTATVDSGVHVVALKASDVEFTFDNEIGAMDGFSFTAAEAPETPSAVCTVTVVGTEVSATANITLGKGSEVIADFNDGEIGSWKTQQLLNFNYYFPGNNVSVSDGALRVEVDYSNSFESGYMCTGLGTSETYVIENGLALGFKIFVPEESEGLRLRMCFYDENNTRKTADLLPIGKVSTLEKGAWYYVKADISAYPIAKILKDKAWLEFYVCDRDDLTNYGYNHLNYDSLNTRLVFYIDDITVDYSSAVEDREAPALSNPTYAYSGVSDASTLNNGAVIAASYIDFAVNVSDDGAGIDDGTAKVYLDGYEVSAAYSNGMLTASCSTNGGAHHIKFEIADKNGNTAVLSRSFTVSGGSNSGVKIAAHDASLQNVLFGSLYYVDVVATEIEKVQSVTVALDLNNMNKWQLDHMEVTDGFQVNYWISGDDNVATVTITRTGDVALTGEAALVSMPIRVYEMPIKPSDSAGAASPVGSVFTYASFKKVGSKGESWPVSVTVAVDKGLVSYTDGSSAFFSGEDVKVMTEAQWWHNDSTTGNDYLQWNGGHDHRAETKQYYAETLTNHVDAVALEDKAATCTESGYTGRTYCETCHSVVDWGTTVPATGHTYDFVDGVLQCTSCGELFTGTWTDGKEYVDGVTTADGWVGDSYYVDGAKLTGLQEIDGYYYIFNEDGVCENQAKANGFFYDESVNAYRYFTAGIMTTGDVSIYPEAYFFDANGVAVSGQVDVLGYTCYFTDQGAFDHSDDASVIDAGYCGTNIQYVLLNDGTLKVDGEGVMRDYSANGIYPAWVTQNYSNQVTSLVVGNGITKIGKFGFFKTPYLQTIAFEENSSLETIGWGAFGHCWRLTGVTIPASVVTLDSYAFYECGAMTYVDFKENSQLTTINYGAFLHGMALETVFIPHTVTRIGADVFYNANPEMVLQVAEGSVGHSYAVNNNLKYELREGVVVAVEAGTLGDNINWTLYSNGTLEISGSGAMPNFTSHTQQPWAGSRNNIQKVVIGKDITTVGNYAFAYAQNIVSATFEEGSKLETVGVLGFFNNPKLTEIVLPETVTYISSYAFGDCFELVNVYIPQSTSGIYKTAFSNSAKVVLNVAAGSYGETFAEANNISYTTRDFVYTPIASGTCGENVTWAMYENGELWLGGSGAMENYTSHTQQPWANFRHTIKKIVVGKDVTSIGNYAFAYCQNVTAVAFEEGSKLETVGVLGFFNNPKLTEIVLPETVTYISSYAFGDCFELVNVYIPQSTSGIYKTAFSNSAKVVLNVAAGSYGETFAVENSIPYTTRDFVYTPIASGTCGENVTWAMYENGELWLGGSGAMENYTSHTQQPWANFRHTIKKVVVGKDVTSIGNYAFAYCQNVTAVAFKEGSKLETVGVLGFFNNPKLTEIALPETVTYISSYALGSCFELTNVYIPQSTSGIYKTAFSNSAKVVLNVAAGSYGETFAEANNISYTVR